MAHMPPELIDKVFAYLSDEKKTLRSVRLVSKRFAGIGARSLFRTLLIYQRRDSWQKVISVAESATSSPYVRRIDVASPDYLPCLGSFETWRKETSDMRMKMADKMGRLAILNEDNDLIPGAELDPRLEHQYIKFLGWFDGERFLASAVDQILKDPPLQPFQIILPLLALQPFLNLRSVEMIGAHELWDCERSKRDENATLPSFHRREMETGVSSERCQDADNKHLTLILWAVQASQCNIVTLVLHHYREALASKDSPCPTLKTLKHLVLSFCWTMQEFNPVVEAIFRDRMEWKFAPWLAEADSSSTLVLSEDVPVGYHANVFDIFETIHWPKLESVDLRTVMTPDSSHSSSSIDVHYNAYALDHQMSLRRPQDPSQR